MLCTELAESRNIVAALARAGPSNANADAPNRERERIPMRDIFDGMRSKLQIFITQLWLKAAA